MLSSHLSSKYVFSLQGFFPCLFLSSCLLSVSASLPTCSTAGNTVFITLQKEVMTCLRWRWCNSSGEQWEIFKLQNAHVMCGKVETVRTGLLPSVSDLFSVISQSCGVCLPVRLAAKMLMRPVHCNYIMRTSADVRRTLCHPLGEH